MIKKSVIITIISIVMIIILGLYNNSYAALQANGGEPAKQTIESWLYNIRLLEANGQGLGLNENVNSSTLLSDTSNGIDSHMQKNTEYGAMAILSASAYGNPNNIADGETTTGNKSGAVIHINNEMVSAALSDMVVSRWKTMNSKYKNVYGTSWSEKLGDAISTASWHGATGNSWFGATHYYGYGQQGGIHPNNAVLIRAHAGSLFSYYGYSYSWKESTTGRMEWQQFYDAYYTKTWATRGVVVIGEGL